MFPLEFRMSVDCGVNLAAQRLPSAPERQCEIMRRHLTHNHQINVAVALLAACSDGAVDECRDHLRGNGLERLRENID